MYEETNVASLGFLLGLLLSVAACTTTPSAGIVLQDSSSRGELTEQFRSGEARLECQLSCSGTWGTHRRSLKLLHDAGVWKDLALDVLRIGYYSDLSYYYLGRAAEGLRHYSAAEIYYRLSNASTMKCNHLFNLCDGFVFPRDTNARLTVVMKTIEETKSQHASASELKEGHSATPSSVVLSVPDQPKVPLPIESPKPDSPKNALQQSETSKLVEAPRTERPPTSGGEKTTEQPSAMLSEEPKVSSPAAPLPQKQSLQKLEQQPEAGKSTGTESTREKPTSRGPEEQRPRPNSKETGVTVKDSEFDLQAKFEGKTQKHTDGVFFIRSWVNKKTGETTHQLYIADVYTGKWKFWVLASDDQATPLKLVAISRDVESCRYGSCIYTEHIGIDIPDSALRKRSSDEYRIKIKARSGHEKIIAISQELISAQLDEIDRYKTENRLTKPPAKMGKEKVGTPL